jgi:AcrR family transcriptional regulator
MPSSTTTPDAAPRPQRADARRNHDRLLGAARAVFTEQGPDAPLEEVARRAGVGIGTLYRHFPTREALITAVFFDRIETLRARAEELAESESPVDALRLWLREQLDEAAKMRGLGAMAMNLMLCEQQPPQACAPMRDAGATLLARAQAAGEVRTDTDIDDLLHLVVGIGLASEDAPDGAALADRLFALMLDGVRA